MTSLPDSIAAARNLKQLVLSQSKIRSLPTEILGLPLERCSIDACPITALPNASTGLVALTNFDASFSMLESLPEWIGGCSSLREVLLQGAPIRSVPASILACKELTTLRIDRNAPLDAASKAVLGRFGKGIVEFCSTDAEAWEHMTIEAGW
jgi:Leucine-rich repeat (LRR) protein